MRLIDAWTVGEYEFTEHDDKGRRLYTFTIGEEKRSVPEFYASLDAALVAAVGEKWTGPRGAGGSGTDTAAGWFMRMIGAENPA